LTLPKYWGILTILQDLIVLFCHCESAVYCEQAEHLKINEEMRSQFHLWNESPGLLRLHLQFAPFLAMTVFLKKIRSMPKSIDYGIEVLP
jgi:hypothetical protein